MDWMDSFLERLVALMHPLLIEIRNRLLSHIRFDIRTAMDLLKKVHSLTDGKGVVAELRVAMLRWGIVVILAAALLGLLLSLLFRAVRNGKGLRTARVPMFLLAVPYLVVIVWLALALGFTDSLRRALSGIPEMVMKALAAVLAVQAFAAPHRFAMRRTVSAVIQTLGAVPLALGAYLFNGLSPMSIVALSDEMIAAVLFVGIGAAFVFWRLTDAFLVLFGGLSPRGSRKGRGGK